MVTESQLSTFLGRASLLHNSHQFVNDHVTLQEPEPTLVTWQNPPVVLDTPPFPSSGPKTTRQADKALGEDGTRRCEALLNMPPLRSTPTPRSINIGVGSDKSESFLKAQSQLLKRLKKSKEKNA